MRKLTWLLVIPIALSCGHSLADPQPKAPAPAAPATPTEPSEHDELKAEEHLSKGAVTIGGHRFDYTAVAGTLMVKPKEDEEPSPEPADDKKPSQTPTAMMSYVAYFAGDGKDTTRPITFLYNGGPGVATIWLHMGAFGPRRVVTADGAHTAAAPYQLIDNNYCLLDTSDLVFIDAPGTGFGKIAGKDKEKTFYGVDVDAEAFAEFITQFLSKHGRWNSPKYLFGESYGTTRSAVLAYVLETRMVELNGVILLSQILSFDANTGGADDNPGVDLPYQLALPTYAATAWYHKKLPNAPGSLEALLVDVEKFAMTDYGVALAAGNTLDPTRRKAVIEKLHNYTGLPATYLDKANLRITSGMFAKALQDDVDLTTSGLDSRVSGPSMDPLSKEADYDPQIASIGGPYIAAYNDYTRKQLKFGSDKTYKSAINVKHWDAHARPGAGARWTLGPINVMPDLAAAMKFNPNLRVQLEAGYFDNVTPFYQAVYELQHLAIPTKLQSNIEMRFYSSGHMIYANEPSLHALHDNVAAFIRQGGHRAR